MNEIILGLIAVLFQGIFAGSETAFSRANWIRLMTWQKKRTTSSNLQLRANRVITLLENKEQILIITLIFTNLFIVVASVVFSRFFIIYFGYAYTSLAIIIVVFLSLVFGDFLPKVIAQAFPEYWTIIFGPIIRLLLIIFFPFLPKTKTKHYQKISQRDFLLILKEKKTKDSLSINQMAKALFEFSRMTVAEIMVPKERIVGLSDNLKFASAQKILEKYRFSRYPVYQYDTDKIMAIIHIKDILTSLHSASRRSEKTKLSDFFRKPYFVSANTKAMTVLKAMSQRGEHLAIVQNQKQETIGIITLEDLLEEVVGEIRSEA